MSERYAAYFAPAENSPLHRSASAWLGRDAWSGAPNEQPEVAAMPRERLTALTNSPRRYGFHATVKAPFALGPDCSATGLTQALRDELAGHAPFDLPLKVALLEGFLALVPVAPSPAVVALEAAVVAGLDRFRAEPSPAELARRQPIARRGSQS